MENMGWMHESRALRAQIHSGRLTEVEAAERLAEASGGGLTVVGALGILRRPAQEVADEYRRIQQDALAALDRLQAAKARLHLRDSGNGAEA